MSLFNLLVIPKINQLIIGKLINSSDLSIVFIFNTYKNLAFLPSPICNPGRDFSYAAFFGSPSNYLYYITGNDNQMHYAVTLDEHDSNIIKYLK